MQGIPFTAIIVYMGFLCCLSLIKLVSYVCYSETGTVYAVFDSYHGNDDFFINRFAVNVTDRFICVSVCEIESLIFSYNYIKMNASRVHRIKDVW